jgi:aryl-alcohol dehydrogenase-like predicted oxidoreductase
MVYAELGKSGCRVSRLCLGTMNFGPFTSEKDSFAIMDRAIELGINFFDTADRYGGPKTRGRTEEIIGRWLAQGDRRDRIVLASKVFGIMGPSITDRGLSAYHIRRGCEQSLRRLQTDHIDLYQMHHVDLGFITANQLKESPKDVEFFDPEHLKPGPPWEEIWQAMETLVRRDRITYVGSSNFAAWNVVEACEAASRRNFLGLVSEQSVYNILMRQIELELIPACRSNGVGILCYSPIAKGMLAGAVEKSETGRRSQLTIDPALKDRLRSYEELCRDLGEHPALVALAWLLKNPVVTSVIIGPRTMEQLESSPHALEINLSEETLKKIDELFPGPGGEAPTAYAW